MTPHHAGDIWANPRGRRYRIMRVGPAKLHVVDEQTGKKDCAIAALVCKENGWRLVEFGGKPLEFRWWERLFSRRVRAYLASEKAALPDGTRVRLVCGGTGCGFHEHDGIWTTSWTPRRMGDINTPDDYKLTRESDGYSTYAHRNALEIVSDG